MRRILLIILLVGAGILSAAEFKVTGELEKLPFGYVANNVPDADGVYCAKLQINSDIRGMGFDSNRTPVKIEKEMGKYFVYLSPGERSLTFLHEGFAALEYKFPLSLEANTAYVMTVVRSGYGSADAGVVAVTFEFNVSDVYIVRGDNPPLLAKQRSAQYRLQPGSYEFRFFKSGYKDVVRTIDVAADEKLEIILEKGESSSSLSLPGIVIIDSEPQGAEIYLNDQKTGITPWQYELIAGEYQLTLKAAMHHSIQQEFTLAEGQTLELPKIKLLPRYGFWEVSADHSDAEIYLDDVYVARGEITKQRIESGNHKITVKKDSYHDWVEDFLVSDGDEKTFSVELKPAFGTLQIGSSPEDGADVYINGQYAGKTPYKDNKCLSGQYRIKVEKELFVGGEEVVVVRDEKLTQKTVQLLKNFGVLNLRSAGSELFIDGKNVGRDSYKANLQAGNYQLEARKEKHKKHKQEVYLGVGDEIDIDLHPEPVLGSVTIMSNPPESKGAAIWVNGSREKKTTPAVLPLLIGEYQIKVQHARFLEQTKNVSIEEGKQKKLTFDLETYEGSMLSKRNAWRRNGWLGMGATILALGAGVYFNDLGEQYSDDYQGADTTTDAAAALGDAESSFDNRDICYSISIAPAIYTLYSWIKAGTYSSRSQK